MEDKDFKTAVKSAKEQYFAAADAALSRQKLETPSIDSFRKVLAAGKKARKNQAKKAAS